MKNLKKLVFCAMALGSIAYAEENKKEAEVKQEQPVVAPVVVPTPQEVIAIQTAERIAAYRDGVHNNAKELEAMIIAQRERVMSVEARRKEQAENVRS